MNLLANFYDKNGKLKRYHIHGYVENSNAIFKIDNGECLKWITDSKVKDPQVNERISDLKPKGFYQISDVLYDKNGVYSAFTMKLCQKDHTDIVLMPTEYTLENLYNLFVSFYGLAFENIVASDMCSNHAIVNEDGITIVKTDGFYLSRGIDKKMIVDSNYKKLLYLFRDIYLNSLYYKHDYTTDSGVSRIVYDLFDNKEDLISVEKKLTDYKYPIDYIQAKRRELHK